MGMSEIANVPEPQTKRVIYGSVNLLSDEGDDMIRPSVDVHSREVPIVYHNWTPLEFHLSFMMVSQISSQYGTTVQKGKRFRERIDEDTAQSIYNWEKAAVPNLESHRNVQNLFDEGIERISRTYVQSQNFYSWEGLHEMERWAQ